MIREATSFKQSFMCTLQEKYIYIYAIWVSVCRGKRFYWSLKLQLLARWMGCCHSFQIVHHTGFQKPHIVWGGKDALSITRSPDDTYLFLMRVGRAIQEMMMMMLQLLSQDDCNTQVCIERRRRKTRERKQENGNLGVLPSWLIGCSMYLFISCSLLPCLYLSWDGPDSFLKIYLPIYMFSCLPVSPPCIPSYPTYLATLPHLPSCRSYLPSYIHLLACLSQSGTEVTLSSPLVLLAVYERNEWSR